MSQASAPVLSIVLGTLDRLPLLIQCIGSIRDSCGPMPYEIVVVDGGSVDGTAEYLQVQEECGTHVIWQGERRGAIAAFNAGFAAARGRFVCNLNDDAMCIGPILPEACRVLAARDGVGQIALPFSDPRHPPAVHKITVGTPPREYLYANFGVTRKELGDRLGWWGNGYHYGGDTELSLQIWKAGYSVMPIASRPDMLIRHYRMQDATRIENVGEGRRLGQRWQNWDGLADGSPAKLKKEQALAHGHS